MTLLPPTDQRSPQQQDPQIGLLGGRWVPHPHLCLPIDDLGFRQGATAVERLRTYGSEVFQLDAHLDRWRHSVQEIGIEGLPLRRAVEVLIGELIGRNQDFVDAVGDFGITMFATPGRSVDSADAPTFGMHLNVVDHARNQHRRDHGQPLVVTDICPPPESSWPRSIKVRCRLHYYLADRIAAAQNSQALGILVDHDGSVTETSIANIAIVEQGDIVSPPSQRVLGGITQQVIEQLARQSAINWSHSPITSKRLAAADEILLMGTDTGIWFASSLDGHDLAGGTGGEVYLRLRDAFDAYCGQ